jgi:hypothetical protein
VHKADAASAERESRTLEQDTLRSTRYIKSVFAVRIIFAYTEMMALECPVSKFRRKLDQQR